MIKQNMQDERVAAQRRKIQSDAFSIIFFVLLISALVQEFLLEAPFEQYAVEVICFFGMAVYIIIRNIALGNNIFGDGERAKAILLTNTLVAGITATVVFGVLNYTKYAGHYENNIGIFISAMSIFFISVTLLAFAVLLCVYYLNKKRQAKIQKQLDDDEQYE